jgi:hypothetical protein
MTADDAKARLLEAQAARDKLDELRAAEIAAADKAHREACRQAGKASRFAGIQRSKMYKDIEERYRLARPVLDKQLADAKAAAGRFVMKNDGTPARGGVVTPLDKPPRKKG